MTIKAIDDYFICERLSCRSENRQLIKSFKSRNGENLVHYLLNEAWEEDKKNRTAVYVIRTKDDKLSLFFSLKCGVIYEAWDYDASDENKIDEINKCIENFLNDELVVNSLLQMTKKIRQGCKFNLSQQKKKKYKKIKRAQQEREKIQYLRNDHELESNKNINRAKETYSSIELVHFCSNDAFCDDWRKFSNEKNIEQPLGMFMFWYFIIKIICDLLNIIGCEYLHLFAADNSKDNTLVNYYKKLQFDCPDNLGVVKPLYDFSCKFMCKPIIDIEKQREAYLCNLHIL